MALTQAGAEFLASESKFVCDLFQAAELEVRSTERWLLIALGGIYSYLATKSQIPPQMGMLAWSSPAFIVIFAGIRAFGLGVRQLQALNWLKQTEIKVLGPGGAGWAQMKHPFYVTATATWFYLVLTITTIFIALKMA